MRNKNITYFIRNLVEKSFKIYKISGSPQKGAGIARSLNVQPMRLARHRRRTIFLEMVSLPAFRQ